MVITTAIVASPNKDNDNTLTVSVPLFNTGQSDANGPILKAIISTLPGIQTSYAVGDKVYIGFADNSYNSPIVLGGVQNNTSMLPVLTCSGLKIGGVDVSSELETIKNTAKEAKTAASKAQQAAKNAINSNAGQAGTTTTGTISSDIIYNGAWNTFGTWFDNDLKQKTFIIDNTGWSGATSDTSNIKTIYLADLDPIENTWIDAANTFITVKVVNTAGVSEIVSISAGNTFVNTNTTANVSFYANIVKNPADLKYFIRLQVTRSGLATVEIIGGYATLRHVTQKL